MSNHMQEPWPRFIDICQPSTPIPDSEPVVLLGFDDYRRAKACVNRFAGLSTEFIESGFDIISIIKQRDELLAALNEIESLDWKRSLKSLDRPTDFAERQAALSSFGEAKTIARKAITKAKV